MKVKRFSFLLCLLCLFVCCGMAACKGGGGTSIDSSIDSSGNEENPQIPLTVPHLVLNADYSITWDEVEGASAYAVNVNGKDLPIKNTMCHLAPFTAVGNYTVKVKALRGTEETEYSQSVQYAVYSIEYPNSEQYDIIGADIVYSGESFSFTLVPQDDTYDFSKIAVYANSKKVTLKDNVGTIENITENVVLTIDGLTPLTTYQVTKSQGEGYSIVGKDYAVAGKEYAFQVLLHDGFADSIPTVKVNGSTLQAVNGVYTLKRVTGNLNITVSNVAFSGTVLQKLFRAGTWTQSVEIADGYITVNDTKVTLPINWMKQMIGEGYTHLTFKAKVNGEILDGISVMSGEKILRSAMQEEILNDYIFRIDLSNLKEFELTLQMQDLLGESLSIGELKAYKYTEEWTKSSQLAYVCEENGQIVVDTHGCGENVEVYKTKAVCILGGVNAVLTDENNRPIYFNIAKPNKVIATDMEYYATLSTDSLSNTLRMIVLKDEGNKRPIISFEQSKTYVKQGTPYVDITIQSQEKNSVEYVCGDGLTIQEKCLVYKTTRFACELIAESYKEKAFQMYSAAADIGAIIEVRFVENSFENEFYTSKAWSNINGGTKTMENGQLSITDSWQLNLSASWLKNCMTRDIARWNSMLDY